MKMAWGNNAFKKQYTILLRACIDLGYHPIAWRTGTVVVLRRPGNKDYSNSKAYRPCWDLATKSEIVDKINVENKSENIGI
jgi:hypothetical protein